MEIAQETQTLILISLMLLILGFLCWLIVRRIDLKQQRFRELQEENLRLTTKLAQTETILEEERKNNHEKMEMLSQIREQFSDTFRSLSLTALSENNASFLQLAKASFEKYQEGAFGDLKRRQEAIDNLVKPIRESLDKVDAKILDLEKTRVLAYGGLSEQIKNLASLHTELRSETANLVKALRQPHVRGRWGEMQLRRVAEMAGMIEHCDFTCQTSTTVDKVTRRPDMIVNLPNDQHIVVDAKTPLHAYLEALEISDEAQRKSKLVDHARQVKTHISQLGAKSYWEQFKPTPEFVILFIPGETFFSAALEQDPSLIEYAADQKVMITTPTTLIALLRAVAYGWRQETMTKNMMKIGELGQQLHDRLNTLVSHFVDMGKGLERAVESYNSAMSSMESRVLVTARKFRELGATSNGEISEIEPLECPLVK
jgi:DNA recombination protein RmuC